ncbi:MAG: hypothetical protein HN712_26815 [Gemmatimonadetes bacterium]|nr:hypothetical protein [Gemmatimonadota bacterium]MBT7863953.1 hypothetical protein [Gemmatimonadota bacterium]
MLCTSGSVDAQLYSGLTWEQRWEIADSLDQGSRQAANSGDLVGALELVDAAIIAHPSHYRSWLNRWTMRIRQGLQTNVSNEDLAAMILADQPKIEAGNAHEDQVYVLSFGDTRLFQLTGDSSHVRRRDQRLATHVAEFSDTPRTFDFQLTLAKSVESDGAARTYFDAAQGQAINSSRRRAWSQAAIERGIERPEFLSDEDVQATITQWYSTFEDIENETTKLREEANLVLWHGRLSVARDDSAGVAHLVDAYANRRSKLEPWETQLLEQGWKAEVLPLAIMDARYEALRGDLAIIQGDTSSATDRYRAAWKHIAPILEDWTRDRQLLSGEHMDRLRQRLLPYVQQP